MKKRTFFLIFISVFLLTIGFFAWQGIYSPPSKLALLGGLAKNSDIKKEKIFLVERGENLFQIAENLEKEGLIRNKFLFTFYIFLRGDQKKIQSGCYLLSPAMNTPEIAEKFVSGKVARIKITIPEGFTLKQIEQRLNKKFTNSTKKVISTLKARDFKNEFEFLKDAPDNASLEGFLFPDTYYFSYKTNSEDVARKALGNFDKKLTPNLREEIKKRGKTIFEVVTMASLLEKEVKTRKDKELVAGILWKRLKNDIPLQVDATVAYITGKRTTKISQEDIQIDSPYNTYKYLGLPPGPICNPGLESILAALYSKNSQYWYYLSTSEGETIFSKTLKKHNMVKTKHLK